MKFTTIILAGGQSSRMGSNKALLPYKGKPLIQYSIDLARQFTNDIVLSANNRDLDFLGFEVVNDILAVKAPLAGIHSGLTSSRSEWNLVLTCDMPNVSKALINKLMSELNHRVAMVAPQHDGYIEPLCGFYHRDVIPVIEANFAQGKLSLYDLAGSVRHSFVAINDLSSAETAHLFRNVNAIEDLLT